MDDVYATARWGNRVLRPLTSLYHRLRKYREIQSLDLSRQRSKDDLSIHTARASTLPRKENNRDGSSDSECGGNDPSWVPGKTDKRHIRHKYVLKGEKRRGKARMRSVLRSPEVQKTLPGAIEIATPLITGKSTDKLAQTREEAEHEYCGQAARRGVRSHSPGRSQQQKISEERRKLLKQSRYFQHDSLWKASLDSYNDANYIDIVRRLDRLFLRFLENTRVLDSHHVGTTSRARSLLSTVMRRLPEFIAQEQREHDELDNDEDVDMADAYFTELEAAYGSNSKGWLPLREAVRTQGIYLVADMIKESWLTHLTALSLIEKCIHAGEYDAVERLLSDQLVAIDHYYYPDAFDPWRSVELGRDPVKTLHNYWVSSGHNSYIYDELGNLLLRGAIPPEWMVTVPWKSCMASATSSLSKNDSDSAAATRLIEAVILSASGIYASGGTSTIRTHAHPLQEAVQRDTRFAAPGGRDHVPCPVYIQDALNNLVSSLITAVCGMHFVRADDTSADGCQFSARMGNLLKGLALMVQRDIELRPSGRKDNTPLFHSLRRGYVLLGNCLLLCGHLCPPSGPGTSDVILTEHLGSFLRSLSDQPEIIKDLSALVGEVVRCCERGEEREQSRRARLLCAKLLEFELDETTNLSVFLGKIVVEVAMDFAQLTQDPDDHAWAAEIQETFAAAQHRFNFCGSDNGNSHPTDQVLRPFRWEESIGEWVASTPAVRKTGVPLNVRSKPMVLIPKRSSSSGRLSSSSEGSSTEDNASSFTSSVPSSGLKRSERDWDVSSPIKKRPRSMYGAISHPATTKRKPHAPPSVCSDGSSDLLLTTSLVPTECVLDSPEISSEEKSNIEVLIFNQREAGLASTPVLNRRGRGRPRRPVPPKPPSTAMGPRLPCRSQRRPLVIPCSEGEESEDELSFL
jgi:hypothetical protein